MRDDTGKLAELESENEALRRQVEEQDRQDSENLYTTLTEQVIPLFFDRDEQGVPRGWIKMIRRAMATLVHQFTTDRMLKEYTRNYYLRKSQ